MEKIIIDFKSLGGPVYIGRERGEKARNKLKLDEIDFSDKVVDVVIPDDTYSVNSSFFLGLFGKSIRNAGNRDNFLGKYKFICKDIFKDSVEKGITRALQEKTSIMQL